MESRELEPSTLRRFPCVGRPISPSRLFSWSWGAETRFRVGLIVNGLVARRVLWTGVLVKVVTTLKSLAAVRNSFEAGMVSAVVAVPTIAIVAIVVVVAVPTVAIIVVIAVALAGRGERGCAVDWH